MGGLVCFGAMSVGEVMAFWGIGFVMGWDGMMGLVMTVVEARRWCRV